MTSDKDEKRKKVNDFIMVIVKGILILIKALIVAAIGAAIPLIFENVQQDKYNLKIESVSKVNQGGVSYEAIEISTLPPVENIKVGILSTLHIYYKEQEIAIIVMNNGYSKECYTFIDGCCILLRKAKVISVADILMEQIEEYFSGNNFKICEETILCCSYRNSSEKKVNIKYYTLINGERTLVKRNEILQDINDSEKTISVDLVGATIDTLVHDLFSHIIERIRDLNIEEYIPVQ